jgi:hypothetical protein
MEQSRELNAKDASLDDCNARLLVLGIDQEVPSSQQYHVLPLLSSMPCIRVKPITLPQATDEIQGTGLAPSVHGTRCKGCSITRLTMPRLSDLSMR